MNSLLLLNRMRLNAALRKRFRQALSIKSLIFITVIVVFIVNVRSGFSDFTTGSELLARSNSADFSHWVSAGLLLACLVTVLTSTGYALHFSPAEMNILYSAPISRTALVVNKVLSYIAGAIMSSLLLVILMPSVQTGRMTLFAAMVLTLMFVQMASTALGMSLMLLKKRWPFLPDRKLILLFWLPLTLVLVFLFANVISPSESQEQSIAARLMSMSTTVMNSLPAELMLAPFSLFAGLYQPIESPVAYTLNLVMAIVVLFVLIVLIVRFDRFLQDESSASSLAAHQRWQMILKSGSVWQRTTGRVRSRTVPLRIGSTTSLAWCQWLRLFRTASSIAYGLPCIALISGVIIGILGAEGLANKLLPILFFLFVFMLPKMLAYDFRGAPDIIEKLKTLPVSATRICLGQLAAPVLFASLLQWLFIVGVLPFATYPTTQVLIVLALIAIPINFLIYATENAGFLLSPVRLVPVGRVDFDFLGRTLVDFLVKCVVLAIAVFLVLYAGWMVWKAYPVSWIPAVVVMLVLLVCEVLLALFAVVLAYRRFDTTILGSGS